MLELTGIAVEDLFKVCLFADGELPSDVTSETLPENAVTAEGVASVAGFKRENLEAHRAEILELLGQLPKDFRPSEQGGGGGWSFLNGCLREDGEQWTGFHATVDLLFQMGTAIGAVAPVLPRAMWSALPGGMPYYVVDLEKGAAS